MKMFEYRLKFHWSLFLRVQLTIFQHWFRKWLGAVHATSHYLNQWWLVYWCIYASLGLNELKIKSYHGTKQNTRKRQTLWKIGYTKSYLNQYQTSSTIPYAITRQQCVKRQNQHVYNINDLFWIIRWIINPQSLLVLAYDAFDFQIHLYMFTYYHVIRYGLKIFWKATYILFGNSVWPNFMLDDVWILITTGTI